MVQMVNLILCIFYQNFKIIHKFVLKKLWEERGYLHTLKLSFSRYLLIPKGRIITLQGGNHLNQADTILTKHGGLLSPVIRSIRASPDIYSSLVFLPKCIVSIESRENIRETQIKWDSKTSSAVQKNPEHKRQILKTVKRLERLRRRGDSSVQCGIES